MVCKFKEPIVQELFFLRRLGKFGEQLAQVSDTLQPILCR